MNPTDLPADIVQATTTEDLLNAVRTLAQGPLAARAQAIDEGAYPEDLLTQLAAMGAMSAHIDRPGKPGDYMATMRPWRKPARSAGPRLHDVVPVGVRLYMHASANPALTGERLSAHMAGWVSGAPACPTR
jgi:hypothetical protein